MISLLVFYFSAEEGKKPSKNKTEKPQEPTKEKPVLSALNGCLKNSKLCGSLTCFKPKC